MLLLSTDGISVLEIRFLGNLGRIYLCHIFLVVVLAVEVSTAVFQAELSAASITETDSIRHNGLRVPGSI